jgi:hypothetical protein
MISVDENETSVWRRVEKNEKLDSNWKREDINKLFLSCRERSSFIKSRHIVVATGENKQR